MLRQVICVALVCTLLGSFAAQARAAGEPVQTAPNSGIKEQVLRIPAGAQVEVRLKNNQKPRGRLGEVSDDGFVVQTVKADKLEVQNMAFGDVQSIKQVGPGTHRFRNILIIGVVVVGIVVLGLTLYHACKKEKDGYCPSVPYYTPLGL